MKILLRNSKFKKENSKMRFLLGVPKGKRRYRVNHSEMGGNFFSRVEKKVLVRG